MIPSTPGEGMTIGICSPSHIAVREEYARTIDSIRASGFEVVEAEHLYSRSHGYLAAPQERGADFNQLFADDRVDMILFGGGEGSAEVLPYLDYESIRRHPKCISSFSDGTTILGAIHAMTGLETYYGQAPYLFDGMSGYDWTQFKRWFVYGAPDAHIAAAPWRCITAGEAQGQLIGGYARNFAMLLGSRYFPLPMDRDYILFLEDHEVFGDVSYVAAMLANIEQTDFMQHVRGVLFGHYSKREQPYLYDRLCRMGEAWGIPVAYCNDFGHGDHHAVLPIGRMAVLNTAKGSLIYK